MKVEPKVIDLEELMYRSARLGREGKVDENTFQVRMSSEEPGEQIATRAHEAVGIAKEGEPYWEILSHAEGDVDLSRFQQDGRAPLLDEHKDGRHLGWIKNAELSKDAVTRGLVVFDKITDLSVTRRKQVEEESRPYFSIGYKHTKYLGTRELDGGRTGHVFAWKGLELSSVAVPMDVSARKGRKIVESEELRVEREKKGEACRCLRCGDPYARADLNEDGICEDCVAAETPASGKGEEFRQTRGRAPLTETRIVRGMGVQPTAKGTPLLPEVYIGGMRGMRKNGESEWTSHGTVRSALQNALYSHDDFKREHDNGDKYSSFQIHDVQQDEDGNYRGIVLGPGPEYAMRGVDFDFDGEDALINDVYPVVFKGGYEEVEDTDEDGRSLKRRQAVYFLGEEGCEDVRLDMSQGEVESLVLRVESRKDGKKPYGDVAYADPGYQKDGKKRYPIDTKAHAKAAWNYINKGKNAGKYSAKELSEIKGRIKAACKKFGVEISEERHELPKLTEKRVLKIGNVRLGLPEMGQPVRIRLLEKMLKH